MERLRDQESQSITIPRQAATRIEPMAQLRPAAPAAGHI
jgi:hypothetical protein